MLAIKNANIVLEKEILYNSSLLIEKDKIIAVGEAVPAGADIIDARGAYVGPGFVDIHVHGGGGYTAEEAPSQMAEFFLHHGTTTILPTPSYCLNFEEFLTAIRNVREAISKGAGKTIAGFYMEGPYMNPKYGARAEFNSWRHPLDPGEYKTLVDEAGTLAKVWTIAPEREGLKPFLDYARKVNPDVLFAVGHSEATPDQIRALPYRAALQTHCTNATGRVNESGGCRGTGPDEYCYLDDEMYAELISDSHAVHVRPDIQKLILKVKGVDRVILITDSTLFNHPNPPHLAHIEDLNFGARGELDGSRLTMECACRNVMTHTGCSMVDAFLMASRNPARVLGMEHEIGTVEVGKKANLVFVDKEFHVQKVMFEGALI